MTPLAGISRTAIDAMIARERERFAQTHPKSLPLAERARAHLFKGVPMGWMTDWASPYPIFAKEAKGAHIWDVDGNDYADFCLGDTGSMFGHSPAPIVKALSEHAARGLTYMLPTEDAVAVGELLSQTFGLPYWQVATTASDANRFVLRLSRAATGRPKILVFNGCYHGAVDDTCLRLIDGKQVPRPGLLGQVQDLTAVAKVVEFNDLPGLEKALAEGDVAAVIAEPAMTNIGMVQPAPGFHAELRRLTRKHGTLLIIDETHTISTGFGGYSRVHGLEPDIFTLGKSIAGGVPTAVYGFTAEVALMIRRAEKSVSHGFSGIGTTLSANPLQMRLIRTMVGEVMTPANYAHMEKLAARLAAGLEKAIRGHNLPWHVTRVGARVEFVFSENPPRNGSEAAACTIGQLEAPIHLYFINRGVMIAPFHNMMLCSPATAEADVDKLVGALAACLDELTRG